jgi:hypothetical protein
VFRELEQAAPDTCTLSGWVDGDAFQQETFVGNNQFQYSKYVPLALRDVDLARANHGCVILEHWGGLLADALDVLKIRRANAARYARNVAKDSRSYCDHRVILRSAHASMRCGLT